MSIRIILADDHPFVLLGVRAMLQMHAGLTVVGEAKTPSSLIALLQCTPCDLLVTDLSMPEASCAFEDGLGLVSRVRRDWPLLRIVVMTMMTNSAILRAILADCEVSAISKTESMHELLDAIEAANGGRTYVGRSIRAALEQRLPDECESAAAPRLSDRQTEVIRMVVNGQSISEIAATLGCHRSTVARRKREAMTKLGVNNDPGLFSYVRANQIDNS